MSFSYNPDLAGSSGLSFVRMRVMDTSSGSYKLEDEEIDSLLTVYGSNKYLAAAAAADQIGASYAVRTDKTIGKLSIRGGSLSQQYFNLGKRLRYEAQLQATPFAGGISQTQKDSEIQDTDRVKPAFEVEQFDNPGSLEDSSTAVF